MGLEGNCGGITDFGCDDLLIQDEGVSLGGAGVLNFVGTGVSVTVNNNIGTVTINGGGSSGGSGTVTSVAVVSANGFKGTVANPTTTPTITIDASALNATKIGTGTVDNTEFGYLNGVTSSVQSQFSGKQGNIQFQNQGIDVSTSGGISTINFTGGAVAVSATGSVLTVRCSASVTGSGDVVGPASATDNALAVFDGATGKLIKNSTAIYDAMGNLDIVGWIDTDYVYTNGIDVTGPANLGDITADSLTLDSSGLILVDSGGTFKTTFDITNNGADVFFTLDLNNASRTLSLTGSSVLSGNVTVASAKTLTASNTITLTGTDGVSLNVSNVKPNTIGFSTLSPSLGQQGTYVMVPYNSDIASWNFVVDQGTATVKSAKIGTGTTAPTSANFINTNGVSISTGTAIRSTTLTDFTNTVVSAYDIFAFYLLAVSAATKIDFQLELTRQ